MNHKDIDYLNLYPNYDVLSYSNSSVNIIIELNNLNLCFREVFIQTSGKSSGVMAVWMQCHIPTFTQVKQELNNIYVNQMDYAISNH